MSEERESVYTSKSHNKVVLSPVGLLKKMIIIIFFLLWPLTQMDKSNRLAFVCFTLGDHEVLASSPLTFGPNMIVAKVANQSWSNSYNQFKFNVS